MLEKYAEAFVRFFESKAFLIIMTLAIALCSSSFAFEYGAGIDYRYGIMFGFGLFALTFHYAKRLPSPLVWILNLISKLGLVLLTVFVSSAAFLSTATDKVDPEQVALQSRIDSLESQITANKMEVAALFASNNPINAREKSDERTSLQAQLNKLQGEMQKMQSKNGRYESGSMVIFGHIAKILNKSQELINLIIVGFFLSILVAVEISLGHAATSLVRNGPDSTEIKKKSTETEQESTEIEETSTEKSPPNRKGTKSDKYRMKMRTAIASKKLPDLKYETIINKCGGSKDTAREVLNDLKNQGIVKQQGKSWRWS